MSLYFFRARVVTCNAISSKILDIVTDEHQDVVRRKLKAEANGANLDLSYRDMDTVEQVYQVYCSKCGKKEAAVKLGGGFKCIVCWTKRPGHRRNHYRRRKQWWK